MHLIHVMLMWVSMDIYTHMNQGVARVAVETGPASPAPRRRMSLKANGIWHLSWMSCDTVALLIDR